MGLHRVLIIGVGSIGERHLRCFGASGRAEVGLVEINPELRQATAARYGVSSCHETVEAALRDPPDAAIVATPAPLHVRLATMLAESGVHVLIEKPLGTSTEGVDRLRETVRERRVVAGVAYVLRCHPLLQAWRSAVVDGRFGKPVELVAVAGQHFPTYRPAYRTIYYNSHASGGGAIQDALTHLVNLGQWLLGPVQRVVADAAHQVLEGVTVEDTVHLLARHGDVLASYSLNQHQAPNETTLTVVCERGTVRCELHANRWQWMTEPGGGWQTESLAPIERDTLFIAQANAFLDAIEGRGTPPCPCSIDEGLATLRVNLAALASARTQSWQAIPEHAER